MTGTDTKNHGQSRSPDDQAHAEKERLIRDILNRPSTTTANASVLMNGRVALAMDTHQTRHMSSGENQEEKKKNEENKDILSKHLLRQSFASFIEQTQKIGLIDMLSNFLSLFRKQTPDNLNLSGPENTHKKSETTLEESNQSNILHGRLSSQTHLEQSFTPTSFTLSEPKRNKEEATTPTPPFFLRRFDYEMN